PMRMKKVSWSLFTVGLDGISTRNSSTHQELGPPLLSAPAMAAVNTAVRASTDVQTGPALKSRAPYTTSGPFVWKGGLNVPNPERATNMVFWPVIGNCGPLKIQAPVVLKTYPGDGDRQGRWHGQLQFEEFARWLTKDYPARGSWQAA